MEGFPDRETGQRKRSRVDYCAELMQRRGRVTVSRLSRAAILVAASGAYLASAFKLSTSFWSSGLGDWADPYFINYLLEHWYRSLTGVTDPSSPPMFHPTPGTLGYSHGLILYVPFYVPFRLFVHPFQAHNLTILSVLFLGTVSLYVLCRKLTLSFFESFLVAAVFLTSANVTDGSLGVWSQRASVFLIPTLLLITLMSLRAPRPGLRLVLVAFAGFAISLLYTQDFHTAHFTLLLLVLAAVPAAAMGVRWIANQTEHRSGSRIAVNAAGLVALLAMTWTLVVLTYGGVGTVVFGVAVRSHDWRRPALLAVAAGAFWLWRAGTTALREVLKRIRSEAFAFGTGMMLGGIVFVWIYARAYFEHRAFPEDQLASALVPRDPSAVGNVGALLREFFVYDSPGSFAVAIIMALLAWAPGSRATKRVRIYTVWGLAISIVVLLLPLRIGDFSLWTAVIQPLPGFAAIRDPKRIIYVFELAVVLGAALFMRSFPRGAAVRLAVSLALLGVLATAGHLAAFDFVRPLDVYARWVASPIAIDNACSSFYVKRASSAYEHRPNTVWTTYAIDAMFVSLNRSIPTLNGYSAWGPSGWTLGNPTDPTYPDAVKQWVERHGLRNVCEFDIDARTIAPRSGAKSTLPLARRSHAAHARRSEAEPR